MDYDTRKPMTMTAEAERDIFEKPRGVPQAHEIDRLFAEIDALRAALAEAERVARDEALIRSALSQQWTAARQCRELRLRADTDAKAKAAWERLYNERNRLWREEADRVDAVKLLLEANGCDCDCEHHHDEHDADCDRCLACRISWAIET